MIVLVLLAALAGAALSAAIMASCYAHAAHRRATIAQERLYAAWQAGYAIPPASAVAPPASTADPETTKPLIPALQALVDDWDTPAAREQQLHVIRQRFAEGKTQMEVARDLLPAESFDEPDVTLEMAS